MVVVADEVFNNRLKTSLSLPFVVTFERVCAFIPLDDDATIEVVDVLATVVDVVLTLEPALAKADIVRRDPNEGPVDELLSVVVVFVVLVPIIAA